MAITTKPISFLANANQNVQSFWHWWTHELSALVPKRMSMAFAGDASLTDVAIEDAALVRVKVGVDGVPAQELKRVPIAGRDAASMRAALDELLRGEGRDIRVLVSPEHVLRKRVILPMATEENLLDVVGFDMDRQTPFTADQVYFGAQVVSRDATRERIEAEVVAVPKNVLTPWLNEMRAAAISVHSIVAADEFTASAGQVLKRGAAPIELLPTSAGSARRWSNMQRINVGLLALGLVLILIAVLLPIWQKRETVKALMPLALKADTEFKVTQRVNEDYTRLANEYNYVVGRKHANYPTVMLIDEITKISPDTMWIQGFEYKLLAKTRELQLTGEAPAVSKVIESLEQTPFLQNTQQRQQSRQGSRPNIEYFTLASEVKSRPLPEAVMADALSAMPTTPTTPAKADSPEAPMSLIIPPPMLPTPTSGATSAPTATVTSPGGAPKGAPAAANAITIPMSQPAPAAPAATAAPVPSSSPAPMPARTPPPAPGTGNSPTPIPFPPASSSMTPFMPPPPSSTGSTLPAPLPAPIPANVPVVKAKTS